MARLKLLALLLATMLIIAACGGSGAATQPPATTSGGAPTNAPAATSAPAATASTAELPVDKSKLAPELHLLNWADYIDPEILDDFQKEYGVKVTVEPFKNNEEMKGKVRLGNTGYDIVFPSDYTVDEMAREKLLAPLDKSLLPNLKNIKPELLNLYYDKGNIYSIPYNTGTTGLAYDKTKFPTQPDSWAVVFDPVQAEKYKGQFSMLDDPREVPGAAMKYLGKSLNGTDPADLAKVEAILIAQKPLLAGYDSENYGRNLASGQVMLAHAYNTAALQARMGLAGDDGYPGNPNINFFIPKEGGTIWQDNICILAGLPEANIYTAHVFINYIMRPDVAAKNEQFVLGITPNAEAERLLPADLQELFKEGFAPDAETIKRLEWIEHTDKTGAYDTLWTKVKGE